jgi:hypothetical protein
MTASVTQRGIVAAVADRGYLDGYTLDQRIARQLVKELEEVCEALQAIQTGEGALYDLVFDAAHLGKFARAVFDVPSFFDGATVDVPTLLDELPDLVVPLAVLHDAVGVPDMMDMASAKAWADVARGVRNGDQIGKAIEHSKARNATPEIRVTPVNILQVADPAMGSGAFLGNPPYGTVQG